MKENMRKKLLNKRNTLSEKEIHKKSFTIFRKLTTLDLLKYNKILLYKNFNSEVATDRIIHYLKENNKKIYLPRVNKEKNFLDLYKYTHKKDLERSSYGILEPKTTLEKVDPEALDLIIAPGVGFTDKRYRIGYGGGFYDKLISQSHATVIGIFFECQKNNDIPIESHDQQLDLIVTEKRILGI